MFLDIGRLKKDVSTKSNPVAFYECRGRIIFPIRSLPGLGQKWSTHCNMIVLLSVSCRDILSWVISFPATEMKDFTVPFDMSTTKKLSKLLLVCFSLPKLVNNLFHQ